MEDKCDKSPIDCENWPFLVYQATDSTCPTHQVGQVIVNGSVYRPHVVRVVVNNYSTENGTRGNAEHVHDVYHLIAPRRGCAVVKHNGTCEEILPGEALVISPGEPHCFMTNTKSCVFTALTFEFLTVDGSGEALAQGFHQLLGLVGGGSDLDASNRLTLPESLSSEIHQVAHDMVSYADESPAHACGLLQRLLLDLSFRQKPMGTGPIATWGMESVYKEIRRHFRVTLDIDALARTASMSRRTLTRRFKERYGITVKQMQLQLRMDAALLMLKTTNLQIQEIAAEVGYGDQYQFTSAFTKRFGQSPSAYRGAGQAVTSSSVFC